METQATAMSNGNASAIVKAAKEKGALVFANMENLEPQVELYRAEVSELTFQEKDFHKLNGKLMPSKSATDRIGEACGIQFIQSACRVTAQKREDSLCGKRDSFCAEAQGKVRMPDGSWRFSTVDEYEYDPVLRAMIDKNVTELDEAARRKIGKTIMEYSKVARQRAATGARLRVIRQLAGVPSAFEPAEALKPMVFARIVQNTSYILRTQEGRAMATAQAIGIDIASLFGGNKMPGSQPSGEPDFPDESENQQEEAEFMRLGLEIEQLMANHKSILAKPTISGKNPYKLAEEELASPASTEDTRRKMRKRIMAYLQAKGVSA
jgi:hypothetical protein